MGKTIKKKTLTCKAQCDANSFISRNKEKCNYANLLFILTKIQSKVGPKRAINCLTKPRL